MDGRTRLARTANGDKEKVIFPCSADYEKDWQPYPVDLYSAISDDHTYTHTYMGSGPLSPECFYVVKTSHAHQCRSREFGYCQSKVLILASV